MESDPSNTDVVKGPNHPPVANAQSVTTNEDTSAAITLTGSDVDGDALMFSYVQPAHGMLSGAGPILTYTPASNYNGPDSFTFSVGDGTATSAVALVSITVTAVNDAPVATTGLSVVTAEDTAKPITLSATDVDSASLNFTVMAGPSHGTLTGVAPNLTYTPTANYYGSDSFTFAVSDGSLDSNVATVTITVNSVNDPPVAANESYSVLQDSVLTVAAPGLLANDTDVDSGSLTAVLVSAPTSGTLSLNANGSFTYTPNPGFSGPDSFTYKANDGSLDSNVATASVTVKAAYTLFGLQNVPPAAITRSKAGSTVPMKWVFKDGPTVVDSAQVTYIIRMVGAKKSYEFTNTDPGTSSFRYDATSKAWYFNLQTKDNLGVAYPIDTYDITITPSPSGYLPSTSPFKLTLTK
jgi:hypothetical protein